MKDEPNDIVKDLIIRHLAGETSSAEEQQLFDWRMQSSDHEQQFNDLKKIMSAADEHYRTTQLPKIDLDAEWKRFTETVEDGDKVRSLNTFGIWLKIAASLLLIAVTAGIIYFYSNKNEVQLYATAGNVLEVKLPDGSTVTLNRNSELSFDENFGEQGRNVTLKGEAFFDVQRDTQKPFVISAKDARVEVLGTSFNVQAYDSIDNVEVIVKTGSVRLSVPKINKQVQLSPGRKGIFESQSENVNEAENTDANYISWNTQKIFFNEAHLFSVIETLEKTYHVNIKINGTVSDTCLVTVSFDHQTLDAVLNVLENTLNLKYTRNGNEIEIISTGC